MNQPADIRGPLAPETQRVLNGAWAESAFPLPEPQGRCERSCLATCSGPAAHLVRVIDAIIADAETRWVLNNPGKKSNLKNADIRVEVSIRTLRSASQLLGQNNSLSHPISPIL